MRSPKIHIHRLRHNDRGRNFRSGTVAEHTLSNLGDSVAHALMLPITQFADEFIGLRSIRMHNAGFMLDTEAHVKLNRNSHINANRTVKDDIEDIVGELGSDINPSNFNSVGIVVKMLNLNTLKMVSEVIAYLAGAYRDQFPDRKVFESTTTWFGVDILTYFIIGPNEVENAEKRRKEETDKERNKLSKRIRTLSKSINEQLTQFDKNKRQKTFPEHLRARMQ